MAHANRSLVLSLAVAAGCVIQPGSTDDDAGSSSSANDGSTSAVADATTGDASGATTSVDGTGDATSSGDDGVVPAGCEGLVGGNVVTHDGEIGDETWAVARHRIHGGIAVHGRVDVQPCAIVEVEPGATITVSDSGALRMAGTAEQPILVTSAKAAPAAGDWGGIEIYSSSTDGDNVFTNVTIEYAGANGYGAIWIDHGASIQMTDSIVRESSDVGIDAESEAELREFTGNQLVDNAAGAIRIGANEVDQLGVGVYTPNGEPGILVEYDAVDHDGEWLALGVPFVADGGFRIATEGGSANLAIAAGATIELGPSAVLSVADKGSLHLAGTADARVAIISAKQPPAAGDWSQIEVYATSNGPANVFEHADIRHGGGGGYGQIWVEDGAHLELDDVAFEMSGDACDIETHGTVDASATTWVQCP